MMSIIHMSLLIKESHQKCNYHDIGYNRDVKFYIIDDNQ